MPVMQNVIINTTKVNAEPADIRLSGNGKTTLRFKAHLNTGSGQFTIRYSFTKSNEPIVDFKVDGELRKYDWKMPVKLTSDRENPTEIEKEIHIVKKPGKELKQILKIRIDIGVVDDQGQFVPMRRKYGSIGILE